MGNYSSPTLYELISVEELCFFDVFSNTSRGNARNDQTRDSHIEPLVTFRANVLKYNIIYYKRREVLLNFHFS